MAALIYVLDTLLSLALWAVLLRLLLQWVRADFRNPLAQALVQLTNPLIVPLRRVLPAIGRIDTATCVIALLFALLEVAVLPLLSNVHPPLAWWLLMAAAQILRSLLWILFVAILIYAMLTFIAPGTYSPAQSLARALSEPILRPIRKVVPNPSGLDLSPLWAGILLQALLILLR